ncbi:MAG TPA: N-succinylarginine dihydrolase [Tepidisphaeraceae bacterium]|nr:N-succinylarginine dihydrolase [Tepidisphaeraceae bacterium]
MTEINFDGIVGPTHNYAGLSFGNVASMQNKLSVSNPKQAALEGLAKMKFLMDLGVKQAVLVPQERPHLPTLRRLGFSGSDADILEKVHRKHPALLSAVCSASSMWAANAATVSPSVDCTDGRVHFTPANLISNVHRAIETQTTTKVLRTIFADEAHFVVHDPLPSALQFGDEGAANHTRLCENYGESGVEIFTYGRMAIGPSPDLPRKFPARQTLESSTAIARLHQIDPACAIFLQQHPDAIDAGAFHNDVVAVGNQNVFMYHEKAYAKPQAAIEAIGRMVDVQLIEVSESAVPLAEAIATYLFNSQIVTLADGTMALIAPIECRENPRVNQFIHELLSRGTPIKSAHFVDIRQSMQNGGGPACLRMRAVLSDEQIAAVKGNVFLDQSLHDQLKIWIEKHYRDQLRADDLHDVKLLEEGRTALDELTQILRLGWIFEFQRR